jgi:hypothetical protein
MVNTSEASAPRRRATITTGCRAMALGDRERERGEERDEREIEETRGWKWRARQQVPRGDQQD